MRSSMQRGASRGIDAASLRLRLPRPPEQNLPRLLDAHAVQLLFPRRYSTRHDRKDTGARHAPGVPQEGQVLLANGQWWIEGRHLDLEGRPAVILTAASRNRLNDINRVGSSRPAVAVRPRGSKHLTIVGTDPNPGDGMR